MILGRYFPILPAASLSRSRTFSRTTLEDRCMRWSGWASRWHKIFPSKADGLYPFIPFHFHVPLNPLRYSIPIQFHPLHFHFHVSSFHSIISFYAYLFIFIWLVFLLQTSMRCDQFSSRSPIIWTKRHRVGEGRSWMVVETACYVLLQCPQKIEFG